MDAQVKDLNKAQALVERDVGKQGIGVPFNAGYQHETLAESERRRRVPRDAYARTRRDRHAAVDERRKDEPSNSGVDIGTVALAVGAGELQRDEERDTSCTFNGDTQSSAADDADVNCDQGSGDSGSDAGGSDD